MTTTLMGEELAAAAGIPRTEFDPACAGWVEITDGGEIGYCIPAGITTSPNELYRVSRLLRGHLPTEEQVSSIDELVAGTATSP